MTRMRITLSPSPSKHHSDMEESNGGEDEDDSELAFEKTAAQAAEFEIPDEGDLSFVVSSSAIITASVSIHTGLANGSGNEYPPFVTPFKNPSPRKEVASLLVDRAPSLGSCVESFLRHEMVTPGTIDVVSPFEHRVMDFQAFSRFRDQPHASTTERVGAPLMVEPSGTVGTLPKLHFVRSVHPGSSPTDNPGSNYGIRTKATWSLVRRTSESPPKKRRCEAASVHELGDEDAAVGDATEASTTQPASKRIARKRATSSSDAATGDGPEPGFPLKEDNLLELPDDHQCIKINGGGGIKQDNSDLSLTCRWRGCGESHDNILLARSCEKEHIKPMDVLQCQIDTCISTFTEKTSMANHFRYVHGYRRYMCKGCGLRFREPTNLNDHIKSQLKTIGKQGTPASASQRSE